MQDGLTAMATIAILVASMFARPERATCPGDMYLATGIRRDGGYSCWSPPPPQCASTMPGIASDDCHARYPEPMHIDSRIYCTGGAQPIVVDDRTVGCQRGGWR